MGVCVQHDARGIVAGYRDADRIGDEHMQDPSRRPRQERRTRLGQKSKSQYAAIGLPGDPVAPTSFSGAQENRNS